VLKITTVIYTLQAILQQQCENLYALWAACINVFNCTSHGTP